MMTQLGHMDRNFRDQMIATSLKRQSGAGPASHPTIFAILWIAASLKGGPVNG
jgi:hypothetical protein